MIERNTWLENIDQGKTLVLDARLDQVQPDVLHHRQNPWRQKLAPAAMATAIGFSGTPAPSRRSLGDKPQVTGGRCLPLGQPIDLVIVHQIGYIMITAHSMEKVVTSLSIAITITAYGNNHKFRIGYLGTDAPEATACREGIKHVAPGIVRQLARLTDAGYHQHLVRFNSELNQRLIQCP